MLRILQLHDQVESYILCVFLEMEAMDLIRVIIGLVTLTVLATIRAEEGKSVDIVFYFII
jgi:hypothetical protein